MFDFDDAVEVLDAEMDMFAGVDMDMEADNYTLDELDDADVFAATAKLFAEADFELDDYTQDELGEAFEQAYSDDFVY